MILFKNDFIITLFKFEVQLFLTAPIQVLHTVIFFASGPQSGGRSVDDKDTKYKTSTDGVRTILGLQFSHIFQASQHAPGHSGYKRKTFINGYRLNHSIPNIRRGGNISSPLSAFNVPFNPRAPFLVFHFQGVNTDFPLLHPTDCNPFFITFAAQNNLHLYVHNEISPFHIELFANVILFRYVVPRRRNCRTAS